MNVLTSQHTKVYREELEHFDYPLRLGDAVPHLKLVAMLQDELPPLALSVRQPWAWAILHGGKVIENRSAGAIRTGNMDCRRIALHAAKGMKRQDYEWGAWRLEKHGVTCPPPADLVRGAIIGAVDVVDIVTESDSEWFGGQCGLVLENPAAVNPIPVVGKLGYFRWEQSGEVAAPAKWMANYTPPSPTLFDDLPDFHERPEKPWGKRKV